MKSNYQKLEKSLSKRMEESQLFTTRFASFTKSDYEILMFTVFLDCQEDKHIRDYDISIALGITESKVRSLRLKSQLQYPRDVNWVQEIVYAVEHGTYDRNQKLITVTIEDPSVRNYIRNEIESKFGTVFLSLNSKQLLLPVESLIILAVCAERDSDAILKKLNSEFKKSKLGEIEKGSVPKFLKSVDDVGSLLNTIVNVFTNGAMIINSLMTIIN